jgi:hypothetical protein
MEDYKLLKERYLDNFKSESTNLKVLSICKVVLEHENSDSDYWNEDHGSNDLIRIFENMYFDDDWKDLECDLNNWSNYQLELFTQAILGGYSSYTNNGTYYSTDKEVIKQITKTIPNRFDLLIPIIEIGRKRKHTDFSCQVMENLNFINDHFDILLEKNFNYLDKIQKIIELLNLSDSYILDLKEKIQKASRYNI